MVRDALRKTDVQQRPGEWINGGGGMADKVRCREIRNSH